ncbi:MAG: hypothetical protein GTO63_20335 [Anaerolineae bacterium]|nr:hypothetical protein [Anaerolineae bacterium]NIN97123.1 hypothetical protein [Anaerolineae bacterium]NIQ80096.1 hypothetical protein [Anaerolineae bacterium]
MQGINTLMPFVTALITFVFAVMVFRRYILRKGLHLLIWGFGLTLYAVAESMAAIHGVAGWNPFVFRLWYLCGAILVAAWLGQGTVHLLARRSWANALLILLVLGSLFAAFRVFTAELDPSLLPGTQLSGHAITTGGVRILTPFFNIYGLVALAGGAIYSTVVYWRRRAMRNRAVGTILIALGALAPGLGGTLSRFGLTEYLYLSELVGAVLMFIGFILSTSPREQ